MTIEPITSQALWQNFVNLYAPQTFLQSWEWGAFNETTESKIFRLGVYDDGMLKGVALIIKVAARRGSFLFCPHGPLLLIDWSNEAHFKALIKYLRALGKREHVSFIRISPLAPASSALYALFKGERFRNAPIHMHSERGWILDITRSEEALLKNMRKDARYGIRKAEKDGVIIALSTAPEDICRFYEMYQATVLRQEFTPFSKKYLETEFVIFGRQNNALLLFARYHGEDIAGAMVIFTKNAGFYHHGASTRQYPSITGAHLLQWEAIREAKRRGCSFYNFWGISPENKPSHPWAGTSHFKKGFGGFSEDYLHAQDLVLSPRYWLTYIIETVRRVRRRL